MEYATHYDVGEFRRAEGINEDSVAVSVFEQGHRDGFGGYGDSAPEAGTDGDAPANRSAAVFALADGAGGHDAGDVASYIATTAVCESLAGTVVAAARNDPSGFDLAVDSLPGASRIGDLESAVAAAVVDAHREVLAYAAENDQQAHATVVAGVCVGGRLHYGWVGDSRAYLVNAARDEIVPLTADHAVVERLRDAGEIDDVAALVHPRGNEITRALGGRGTGDTETATVDVETATVPVYAEDILLVTSDGLVDAQTEAAKLYQQYVDAGRDDEAAALVRERAVTDAEIRDRVLEAESLSAAAADLVDMANDRGGKDNVSTILLRDGTLPATPADPPPRAIGVEPPVEDRQTVPSEKK